MVSLHEVPAERIGVRTGWCDNHGRFDKLTTNGNGDLSFVLSVSKDPRQFGFENRF